MDPRPGEHALRPAWWTAILIGVVIAMVGFTAIMFTGSFQSVVPITLVSDRSGLTLEPGSKVLMRNVQVGRVSSVAFDDGTVRTSLDIDGDEIRFVPANVEAAIRAGTAFGVKSVDLISPEQPATARIASGAVIDASHVSTESNTVFENLMDVLNQIDPPKLNAVLTSVADALRGQGEALGKTITGGARIAEAINARTETIRRDLNSAADVSNIYSGAAHDILSILDSATTVGATVNAHTRDLDALLLSTIGLGRSGIDLLVTSKDDLVKAAQTLEPTTDLLLHYNPEYTCTVLGIKWLLDTTKSAFSNGYAGVADAGFGWSSDPYIYPDNLPKVNAKGGPGGAPGCGGLPDAYNHYPVPFLVTDTGFGTGLDLRPNPGIAHPCFVDFLPVTRGIPQPPSIRQCLPGPAPGPVPYPGAPPYGAALYGPGGVPLWPGIPPAPSSADPAEPASAPTPPSTQPEGQEGSR